MSFMDAIKICFSKYVDFDGRARRSEFWWFYLAIFIGSLIPFFGLVIYLATIIPFYAAGARRLHDTDRSGWWQAAPYVPALIGVGLLSSAFGDDGSLIDNDLVIAGGGLCVLAVVAYIVIIVWLASDTHPGPNRFGTAPK